jgi:hypothetical protein
MAASADSQSFIEPNTPTRFAEDEQQARRTKVGAGGTAIAGVT